MKHFRFQNPAARVSDVMYNAATQSFEATVTFFENGTATRYACEVPAPITMSFRDATHRLIAQARRQQKTSGSLQARVFPSPPPASNRRTRAPATIWRRWSHSGFLRKRVA